MQKTCIICRNPFNTEKSKQKTCGQVCANESRKRTLTLTSPIPIKAASAPATVRKMLTLEELPPPEMLPAVYAKRVADMWNALVGNEDTTTRIA